MSARLVAVAFGLLVALWVAEAAVRVIDLDRRWLAPLVYYQSVDVSVHRHSDGRELSYELEPSTSATFDKPADEPWGADPRLVTVNSFGHRGSERSSEKSAGSYRVFAVGGSNTFGAAVSDGDAWPQTLEARLRRAGDRSVEVWNLGVSGYVTRQKVEAARRALSFQPDLILFELANTGPRNVLLTPELDVVARFEADPSLYFESLHHCPPSGTAAGTLFRYSALVRAGVLWADRRLRRIQPGRNAGPLESLDQRAEEEAARRFAAFLAELQASHPDTQVAVVHSAEGGGASWIAELPLWVLDLHLAPDKLDRPDAMHMHPGPEVYAWYGDRLADALVRAGCLDPQEASCRWEDVDLPWVYPADQPPPEPAAGAVD